MKRKALCAGLMVVGLLAACGEGGERELQRWMDAQRRQAPVRVHPLKPPAQFSVQDYVVHGALDPFSVQRLLNQVGQPPLVSASKTLWDVQLARPKQTLEAHPLDSIEMVGSLRLGGRQVALLQVERELHQVAVGQYLGQNFGRVTRVTERSVELMEIVQDGVGAWIERPATLQLRAPLQEGGGR